MRVLSVEGVKEEERRYRLMLFRIPLVLFRFWMKKWRLSLKLNCLTILEEGTL